VSDPKRLLDDPGILDADTRRALEAGRDVEPDRKAQRGVWAALIGQLPPGAIGGTAGGGAAVGGAGGAAAGGGSGAVVGGAGGALGTVGLIKSIGVGVGSGLVVLLAGQAIVGPGSTPAPTPATSVSEVVAPSPSAEPRAGRVHATSDAPVDEAEAEPEVENEAAIEPVRGIAGAGAGRVGAVREEARLIATARQRLLRDDPAGALRLLEAARQRFSDGVLVQEREALAVEALAKSGRREAAEQRARDFQQAHPESPLKDRVRDATR
jgi:hypothetical protein